MQKLYKLKKKKKMEIERERKQNDFVLIVLRVGYRHRRFIIDDDAIVIAQGD